MKRIINGKTYNTETATEIARHQDEGDEVWEALFQSRFGAYFLHGVRETWAEPLSYMTSLPFVEPLSPEQAQKWMEEHVEWETDLIEAHFGEMPEAGEAESRFTLRIPQLLKDRIDKLAKMRAQSTNAWIIRCLETCAPVEKMSSLLAVNPVLAAQWHHTKNGTLRPEDVSGGSTKRIWWRCEKDPKHEWQATPNSRTNKKTGCPLCY